MITHQTVRPFLAGFSTLALAIGNAAAAHGELLISIPPGNAQDTLLIWTDQTGLQILYDAPVVAHWRTRAAVGSLTPLDALGLMLRDTALTYEPADNRTVYVIPGSQYCQPWLSADLAPLPPCVQMPEAMRGARL